MKKSVSARRRMMRKHRGGSHPESAWGYVEDVVGSGTQQRVSDNTGNEIQPLHSPTYNAARFAGGSRHSKMGGSRSKMGGSRRSKMGGSRRSKMGGSRRSKMGGSRRSKMGGIYGKMGGRRSKKAGKRSKKGGFWGQVLSQAAAPFALLGLQQTMGRRRHSSGKTQRRR